MVIEPLINNGKVLWNITDNNLLGQNDEQCHHQIIILVKVVNDASPWCKPPLGVNHLFQCDRNLLPFSVWTISTLSLIETAAMLSWWGDQRIEVMSHLNPRTVNTKM